MNPKLSIIVPAYNSQEYLPACIDSIMHQTYQDFEIIIINDGSEDGTQDIIDAYTAVDPGRIKGFSVPNRGVSAARRLGIMHSAGEWIGFVDSDDTVEPDMYSRLMDNAAGFRADISHCGYKILIPGSEDIRYFHNSGRLMSRNRQEGLQDLLEGTLIEPSLCNKIFKRELVAELLKQSDAFLNVKYNEDLLMNYIMFSHASRSVYEDFCGYNYYSRTASASRKGFSLTKDLDPVKVSLWILKNCDQGLKAIAIRRYLTRCIQAYSDLTLQEGYEKEKTRIRQALKKHKSCISFLNRNNKVKYYLIYYCPRIYPILYYIYVRYFQKTRYV